jgi:hypothetical protein
MKTLQTTLATVLLLVSFSAHAASCLDGSEQIKTTSENGSYYVYKCEDNDAVSESTSDAQNFLGRAPSNSPPMLTFQKTL